MQWVMSFPVAVSSKLRKGEIGTDLQKCDSKPQHRNNQTKNRQPISQPPALPTMSASATCKIAGESGVAGVLRLSQSAAGAPTTIQGEVRGLTPGKHGITVNVSGDLSEGAASTGDIFNPFGAFRSFGFGLRSLFWRLLCCIMRVL